MTLRASVASGTSPVAPGLVLFCDAAAPHCTDIHILGQAQLAASGIATLNVVLPIGAHPVKAFFQGTKLAAASTSSTQTLTVGAGQQYPTVSTLNTLSTGSSFTLTGTVQGIGPSLTGMLHFEDATNGGAQLGDAPLAAATTDFVPLPSAFPSSNELAIAGDFNGDGRLDAIAVTTNSLLTYLGNGDGTFTLKSTLPLGFALYSLPNGAFNPNSIAVADFNADGRLDLALFDPVDFTVIILLGDGDGSFYVGTSCGVSRGCCHRSLVG